jgi:hypothetical protein
MALKVDVVFCFVSELKVVYRTAKLRKLRGILIANGCHSLLGVCEMAKSELVTSEDNDFTWPTYSLLGIFWLRNVIVSYSINYFDSCEMLPVENGNILPTDDILTCVTVQNLYENVQLLDFEI